MSFLQHATFFGPKGQSWGFSDSSFFINAKMRSCTIWLNE
jgi:hypothetical protein